MPRSQHKTSAETGITLLETMLAIAVLSIGIGGGLLFLNQINKSLKEADAAREIEYLLDAGERYVQSHWGLLQKFPQLGQPGVTFNFGTDLVSQFWIAPSAGVPLQWILTGVDQFLPFFPAGGQMPEIITHDTCRVFASSIEGFHSYRLLLIRHNETADPTKIARIDVALGLLSRQPVNEVKDSANDVLRRPR